MDTHTLYTKTMDYLYEKLPMFSRLGKAALKPDLTNTLKFCKALNDPQNSFKSIHIAGTNGKGSVSHMMAAILQEAGYKTGLYTSPHLVDFRERIRINGVPVNEAWVVEFVAKNKQTIEEIAPSFFEVTVAMAFQAFAEQKVDIAIIETGLGGRLDSTNVITPILSIITNISYDHQDLLGNTLQQIASEKAGIIKHKVPVVIGEEQDEISNVFMEHVIRNQSTLYYADTMWDMVRIKQDGLHQYFKAVNRGRREMYDISLDLLGNYQQQNLKTVLASVEVLMANQGITLDMPVVKSALSKVKRITGLRGRWDVVQQHPFIVMDVGHNAAGIMEIMKQWELVTAKNRHIIVGFVKDKDVMASLSLFPKDARYYFCNAQIPRALPVGELKLMAEMQQLQGDSYATVKEAIVAARAMMSSDDALLVTGSFFIVGEAMEAMTEIASLEHKPV